MTFHPSTFDAELEYLDRTHKLRLQQAGLELVIQIRKCIESELAERRSKGNENRDELNFYFRNSTPADLHGGELFFQFTHWVKTADDRISMLNEILAPHVDSGDIPAFTLEKMVKNGESCVVLTCDIAVT